MPFNVRNRFFLLMLSVVLVGCYSSYGATRNTPTRQTTERKLPPRHIYIDENFDGIYDSVELDESPEPVQGNDQWIRDFYGSIKYPASARERGIGGIVVLQIQVNQLGTVESVSIKQSLTPVCDEEAKRALLSTTQLGFVPFKHNSKPVKFRMDIPVGFWLQ